MSEDFSHFLPDAKAKSNEQLELEADASDTSGGTALRRASARAELKRRDHEAADRLANKQLDIASQQAKAAKSAVWASWGSAIVALILGILTVVQAYLR